MGSHRFVGYEGIIREIVTFARDHHVRMTVKPFALYGSVVGLELTGLNADVPGSGNGTKVMVKFAELLDEHRVTGYVSPGGRRNEEFYRRFGFDYARSDLSEMMVRYPAVESED